VDTSAYWREPMKRILPHHFRVGSARIFHSLEMSKRLLDYSLRSDDPGVGWCGDCWAWKKYTPWLGHILIFFEPANLQPRHLWLPKKDLPLVQVLAKFQELSTRVSSFLLRTNVTQAKPWPLVLSQILAAMLLIPFYSKLHSLVFNLLPAPRIPFWSERKI